MKQDTLISGIVIGNPEGFGFVGRLDGNGDDIYLSPIQMRQVFDGDEVLIKAQKRAKTGKLEGKIVSVVRRKSLELIGKLSKENSSFFVIPENPRISQDIIVEKSNIGNALEGQIVCVRITKVPTIKNLASGHITEVLGDFHSPGIETKIAIRDYSIPFKWSEEVSAQVDRISTKLAIDGKRVDLRDKYFITIDGEDAKDFDDAVYCESVDNGSFRLYVAIADVSEYIKSGSPLDKEALKRGNSVYFPNSVIPMLPEKLSNGLCSLSPNEDKLTVVCEMLINCSGDIESYQFYEAVIVSHSRKTYTQVARFIRNNDLDTAMRTKQNTFEPGAERLVKNLHEVFKRLELVRDSRGAISFETQDTKILFTKDKKISKIIPSERNVAHKIIEECMLCANLCAADYLERSEMPLLYRVHKKPTFEKMTNLSKFLSGFNIDIKLDGDIKPSDYQNILKLVKGRDEERIIQSVLLRSMAQANYHPKNDGHFGLAYESYTHFTSPIRRYSDLIIHRGIKALIRQASKTYEQYNYEYEQLDMIGQQVSMTERRAEDATRSAESWLKCEYLSHRVGEEFDGVISSVTGFGLFVLLEDVFIEGLIHISSIDEDYYVFDEIRYCLVGESKKRQFFIGDKVRVVLRQVCVRQRKITLILKDVNEGKESILEASNFSASKRPSANAVKMAKEYQVKLSNKNKRYRSKKKR